MVTIREAMKPGDLGNIVRLHGEFYHEHYGFDTTFEPYVATPLAECVLRQSPRERIWVVEENGQFCGSIAIVENSEKEAQLRWFILDQSVRGKGIGKTLVQKAVEFSKQQGYDCIILWTVSNLYQAIKLYERNGFELTEEVDHLLWGQLLKEQRYDLKF